MSDTFLATSPVNRIHIVQRTSLVASQVSALSGCCTKEIHFDPNKMLWYCSVCSKSVRPYGSDKCPVSSSLLSLFSDTEAFDVLAWASYWLEVPKEGLEIFVSYDAASEK